MVCCIRVVHASTAPLALPRAAVRADSRPALLTPPLLCRLVVAARPSSSQRWADRLRHRTSGPPRALSAAHDELVNGRDASPVDVAEAR